MKRHFMGSFLALICGLMVLLHSAAAMAQTQQEMNAQSAAEYAKKDKALNATYQKLLSERKDDAQFIEKLKKAQRAWLAYRDAMLDLQYPERAGEPQTVTYGSVYPMCHSTERAQLTETQEKLLSEYLASSASKHEGDMCQGSK